RLQLAPLLLRALAPPLPPFHPPFPSLPRLPPDARLPHLLDALLQRHGVRGAVPQRHQVPLLCGWRRLRRCRYPARRRFLRGSIRGDAPSGSRAARRADASERRLLTLLLWCWRQRLRRRRQLRRQSRVHLAMKRTCAAAAAACRRALAELVPVRGRRRGAERLLLGNRRCGRRRTRRHTRRRRFCWVR
ncbi:unnamed protein product, partial [Closterium sp. NIES-54]